MAAPKEKQLVPVAIVFDTETGGLDCRECGVCQICMHSVRLDTFERTGTLNFYIRPYNKKEEVLKPKKKKTLKTKYEIEDEEAGIGELMTYGAKAEEVHGLSVQFLRDNGISVEEGAERVLKFVQDARVTPGRQGAPFLIGQHILFDVGMLEQFMEYAGKWKDFCKLVQGDTDFYGQFQPLIMDTITMSYLALCNTNITSYSLGNLCEAFGIEIDDAHDADSDVTATEDIVKILTSRMRNASGGDEDAGLVDNKQEKSRVHFKI
jgi:DNA polymerase III epsilon subunit-like protein